MIIKCLEEFLLKFHANLICIFIFKQIFSVKLERKETTCVCVLLVLMLYTTYTPISSKSSLHIWFSVYTIMILTLIV